MAEQNSKVIRDLTKEGLNISAADSQFNPLSKEDILAALRGKTMYSNNGAVVTNFKQAPAGSILPYQATVNGKTEYFDYKGESLDKSIKLTIATTSIDNTGTQGEAQTRAEDQIEFVMNSLNFKEQVAVKVLAAMIKHEPDPLNYDDSKIKMLVSSAFRIAIEFQNRAVMFRQKEQDENSDNGEVNVNVDSLTTNTERILYNINENLKNGVVVKDSNT